MILVVGEMPSKPTGQPLAGVSGARLAKLAGTTLDEFIRRSDRHNLIPEPLEKWDGRRARRNANFLLYQFPGYGAVVLCGRKVARAFGMEKMPFLSSVWIDDAGRSISPEIVVIPHPSGRSRWWNDEQNVSDASTVMTRLWEMYVRHDS